MEKSCNKCGTQKPIEMFRADKRRPDGKEGVCKACRATSKNAARGKILASVQSVSMRKPNQVSLNDGVTLLEALRQKHNTHFSLSYHPHLRGFAIQLSRPRFHKEGRDVRELLREAISLPQEGNIGYD